VEGASVRVINFDNDGRDDLMVTTSVLVNMTINGTPQTPYATLSYEVFSISDAGTLVRAWPSAGPGPSQELKKLKVIDINGDGLSDLLYWNNLGWQSLMGTGHVGTTWSVGWFASSLSSGSVCVEDWTYYWNGGSSCTPSSIPLTEAMLDDAFIYDYNRDGRSDVLFPNSGNWHVLLGDNAGFQSTVANTNRAATNPSQAQIVDDRGDGIPDLLYPSGSNWFLSYGRNPLSGVVEKITDGLGAETTVQYASLTTLTASNLPLLYGGSSGYATVGNPQPTWPVTHFAAPLTMVYQYAADNGLNNGVAKTSIRTTYKYSGLKLDREGRGLLGFMEVLAWNDNTEIETKNQMFQAFPYTGMVGNAEQRYKTKAVFNSELTGTLIDPTSLMFVYQSGCETNPACVQALAASVAGMGGQSWPVTTTTNVATYWTQNGSEDIAGQASIKKKIWFPWMSTSTALTFPFSGSQPGTTAIRRVFTEFLVAGGQTTAYDAYGNPTQIRVTTNNATSGGTAITRDEHVITTTNTYVDTAATWCLGRLTAASVLHSKPGTNATVGDNPGLASITRNASFTYTPDDKCVLQTETTAGPTLATTLVKTYSYDTFGNRFKEVADDTDGTTSVSRATGATLADGATSAYLSTLGQFPSQARNALGHIESYVWDVRFGVKTDVMGPNGLTAHSDYDTFGRKVKDTPLTAQGGIYSEQGFFWCSGSAMCTDARGVYVVRNQGSDGALSYAEFDRLGREVRTRKRAFNGADVYAVKYFDPAGREYLTSDPFYSNQAACFTLTKFDPLGRPIEVNEPYASGNCDGVVAVNAAAPVGSKVTTTVYDIAPATGPGAVGMGVKTTSAGRTAWKVTNAMGRTRYVRDDLTGTACPADAGAFGTNTATCLQTEYDYDAQGNLSYTKQVGTLGVTAGQILKTRVMFNTRGFKTQMIDPDMGTWDYTYNAYGELLTQTDALSARQTITMGYDSLGRMTSRADHADGTTIWTYDSASMGIGKLAQVTAPNGYVENYTYDAYGRLSQVKRAMDGAYYYVDQSYDALGRVDVVKYPGTVVGDTAGAPEVDANRLRVRNNYNAYGYLSSVQDVADATSYWTANQVDESGRVTEEKLGNGLFTQRTFDRSTGYLRNIKTGTSAGATGVQNLEMSYDQAANLTMRKDIGPGVNAGNGLREEFGYDALFRMTASTRYTTGSGGVVAASDAYSYDDFGNLKTKGTSYTGYAYGVARPHAVSGVTAGGVARGYTYNGNGNLTAVTGSNTKYDSVTWWASNLAKRVSKGATYTEFTYGPDRARYKQYVFRNGTNTETTHYVGGLYEKVSKVLSGTTTLDHSHYVRAGDSVIAIIKRTKVGAAAPTGLFAKYPHRDHLGSIVALSDAGGALLERSGFDPWGKRVDYSTWTPPAPGTFSGGGSGAGGTTTAVTSTRRGFTGHEQVEEFGFIHMNGRIYDPEIGRFLSADPTMQFPESTQGFNRYAYAGNNPLTNVDPSGFGWLRQLVAIVAAAIVAYVTGNEYLTAAVYGFIAKGSIKGAAESVINTYISSWFGSGNSAIKNNASVRFQSGSGEAPGKGGFGGAFDWRYYLVQSAIALTRNSKGPDGKLENGAGTRSFWDISSVTKLFTRRSGYISEIYTDPTDNEFASLQMALQVAGNEVLQGVQWNGTHRIGVSFGQVQSSASGAETDSQFGIFSSNSSIVIDRVKWGALTQSERNSMLGHELIHVRQDVVRGGPRTRSISARDEGEAYLWQRRHAFDSRFRQRLEVRQGSYSICATNAFEC
jgi:RHS repeat-associated protein